MNDPVLLEHDGALAVVTLNRPQQHNVIGAESAPALVNVINTLVRDVAAGSVRAVLLRGSGGVFCAGGDIHGFVRARDDLATELDRTIPPLNAALLQLAGLPVPVVSAAQGAVGGGGIALMLVADVVLAGASLGLRGGYNAIGLTPDIGSSWFVTRAIGPQRAKRLFFCNDKIGASEALELGLVSQVLPDEQLHDTALALARRLAAGATRAFGRTKLLVDGALQRSLAEQLALEHAAMVASGADPEAAEGVAAFMGKRAPRFV